MQGLITHRFVWLCFVVVVVVFYFYNTVILIIHIS